MLFKTFAILSAAAISVANAQLATVCANVNTLRLPPVQVTVLGQQVTLASTSLGSLCLCEDVGTGLLTTNSREVLRSAITGTGALGLTGAVVTNVIGILEPTALTAINQQTSNCIYPTNAVSTCTSTACSFTCPGGNCVCPSGSTLTPIAGTDSSRCVALSASTRKRRAELHARSFGACPFAQTACAAPRSGSHLSRQGYECINTAVNVESCGGCRYPLEEASLGRDCTEIPHTDAVSCVASRCVISSCARGFSLSADGSECI